MPRKRSGKDTGARRSSPARARTVPHPARPRSAAGDRSPARTAKATAITWRLDADEMYQALKSTLEEADDRYHDLFEFTPLGLMSLNEHGVVREANGFLCRLLGRERHHLLDHPFIVWVAREDRRLFLEMLRRIRAGTVPVPEDLRVCRPDGSTVPVQVLLRRSRFDKQVVFRAVLVDLTERYRHEQERLAAEVERERLRRDEEVARWSNEAKDRFLAVLSHEMRTPLTPVLFAVARLNAMHGIPDEARHLLRLVARNLDLERQLIDDLLDMNRIASGKLVVQREPLDLHDIVRDVVALLDGQLQERQLRVHIELEAARSRVRGDRNRLRQVFWNLLANAVKFTAEGGEIRVASDNPTPSSVVLSVSDTGVGIEPERLARLFSPFEQIHRGDAAIGGLGLGLSICKGLIEAHEGGIRVDSAGPGQGTRFEVELPVLGQAQAVAASAHEVASALSAAPGDGGQA